jgi:hypothetical protein
MGLQYRWTRSLDPAVNKEDWSEQEELKLIRAHQIYGSQWLKMVKHFPGRYDWMIFTVKEIKCTLPIENALYVQPGQIMHSKNTGEVV